jgi:hypothetical protein
MYVFHRMVLLVPLELNGRLAPAMRIREAFVIKFCLTSVALRMSCARGLPGTVRDTRRIDWRIGRLERPSAFMPI